MKASHKLCAASIIASGMLVTGTAMATGGWATERAAIDTALEGQRALGYQPCQPTLVELGDVPGAAAWAAWPEEYGVCEVGIAPDSATWEPTFTAEIAWHEVCHLSTGHGIATDLHTSGLDDLYHVSQAFKDCMSGAIAPPPPPVGQVQMYVDGNHVMTTDTDSLTANAHEEARLCADLQEAKPWIEWGCDAPATGGWGETMLDAGDGYVFCGSPDVRITQSECEAQD